MKIWQFTEVTDGGPEVWSWRVLGHSGDLEDVSEPHRNYGAAVTDAIKHGFRPSNDHWVVITSAGAMHFEPAGATRGLRGVEKMPVSRVATDGKGTGD